MNPNSSKRNGIAKLRPFRINPRIMKRLLACGLLFNASAVRSPGIASPKTMMQKKGRPQMMSLSPLRNGGNSMSARNTKSSMPIARNPVTNEKYFFIQVYHYEIKVGINPALRLRWFGPLLPSSHPFGKRHLKSAAHRQPERYQCRYRKTQSSSSGQYEQGGAICHPPS